MTDIVTTFGSDAVTVHAVFWPGHDFHEMHHYGEDGKHYCPTGFAICHEHFGMDVDPDVCPQVIDFDGDCRLWGEDDDASGLDMTEAEFDALWEKGEPVEIEDDPS